MFTEKKFKKCEKLTDERGTQNSDKSSLTLAKVKVGNFGWFLNASTKLDDIKGCFHETDMVQPTHNLYSI